MKTDHKRLKSNSFRAPRPPRQRPGKDGGARARNRGERIRALCISALSQFLAQGIDGTSIAEIARGAGVGKASFYSYFRDKAELVDTLLAPARALILGAMDRCLERIEAAADFEAFRAAQQIMAAEIFAALSDELDLLRLVLQEARGPSDGARAPIRSLHDDVVARAVHHNEAALARNLIRPVHPRVMAYINLGALERLGAGFLDGTDLGDPQEAIALFADIMLAGLAPPPAPAA